MTLCITIVIRLFFLSFAILATTSLKAAPVGAAVSWVAYDNRQDFLNDRLNIDRIVHGVHSGAEARPVFFGIPKERHFSLPTNSWFEEGHGVHPSFEADIDKSLNSLVPLVRTPGTEEQEPYLVVALSSHGSNGTMARNYARSIPLEAIVWMVFDKAVRFYGRTKKKLRIEFLYSACHSGSLIKVIEDLLHDDAIFNSLLGPVSALTLTTDDKIAYSDLDEGCELWNLVINLAHDANYIARKKAWAAQMPTVAEFSFFNHLGATQANHPQVYSSAMGWETQDSLEFLNFFTKTSSHHGAVTQRALTIDLAALTLKTQTISEATNIVAFKALRNNSFLESQDFLFYLRHPAAHVRYAAAGYLVTNFQASISRNKYLGPYGDEANSLLAAWAMDPQGIAMLGKMGIGRFNWHHWIEALPISHEHVAATLEGIKALVRTVPMKDIARPTIDLLREILVQNYFIAKVDIYSRVPRRSLSEVPEDLLKLIVRAHFVIPHEVPDEVGALNAALVGRPNVRSSLDACESASRGESTLLELAELAIRKFDSGTYTDDGKERRIRRYTNQW